MRTLNCKRMARMISLYVAGDLVGEPEREVAAHLAVCDGCRRLSEEFSASSSLLIQACRPPEFGAEFYSGIRQAVLGEVTRDRMQSKPSLFRLRWFYATAFAIAVIASAVVLQHLSGAGQRTPQGLASALQSTVQPTSGQVKGTNPSLSPQSSDVLQSSRKSPGPGVTPGVQSKGILALANPRRRSTQFEPVKKVDAPDATQGARDESTQIAQKIRSSTRVGPVALEPSSQVSRIEIQTADPNIRIIWLVSRESRESEQTNHDQDQRENGNRK
jgi:hypothetical protein